MTRIELNAHTHTHTLYYNHACSPSIIEWNERSHFHPLPRLSDAVAFAARIAARVRRAMGVGPGIFALGLLRGLVPAPARSRVRSASTSRSSAARCRSAEASFTSFCEFAALRSRRIFLSSASATSRPATASRACCRAFAAVSFSDACRPSRSDELTRTVSLFFFSARLARASLRATAAW